MSHDSTFDVSLVKGYPKANRKLSIVIDQYSLSSSVDKSSSTYRSVTTFISPHGLEFFGHANHPKGSLLKIAINIPDFWPRKKKLVNYSRIDTPGTFHILAKVIDSQDVGKRRKKRAIIAKVVNIDEVDEEVLRSFLDETK